MGYFPVLTTPVLSRRNRFRPNKNALFLVSRDLRQNWRLDRFLFLFSFGLVDRLSGRIHEPRGVLEFFFW